MVEWYHQLNEHEFEKTMGHSEGQRSLTRCGPRGLNKSGMTAIKQQQRILFLPLWKDNLSFFCKIFLVTNLCCFVNFFPHFSFSKSLPAMRR